MKTTFIVRSQYTGEEGKEIKAFDHADAAEEYAEWSDISSADYTILAGHSEVVTVEGPTGEIKIFRVYGETVPHYNAVEVTGK